MGTDAIQTAITAAETSALGVGTMVVGSIAALAVVGLVIGMVRKL